MATCGERACFHGAYKSRETARRKAESIGGRVLKRRIQGQDRFVVVTEKSGEVLRFKG